MRRQSVVVDLNAMDEEQRAAFIKDLYQFHRTVFDGVDESAFSKAMLNPHSSLNKVKIWKDVSGQVFAYCAVHRADLQVEGKSTSVFKVEVAVRRDQRGRALSKTFIGLEFLRHFLRRPFHRTYFLSAFVHPASYRMASGSVWKLYPSWKRPTPPELEQLMNTLADKLGYQRNAARPWTRKVGWTPREDNAHHAKWEAHPSADIRFFLERNPDYRQGNGLLSIMPFTFSNIAVSAAIRQRQRAAALMRLGRRFATK